MIYDHLDHAACYRGLSSHFAHAFDYLLTFNPATPPGRIAVDGNDVYASVQHYTTTPAAERSFEAHRRYADIQCVFAGRELIHVAPLDRLVVTTPYVETDDYALYSGPNDLPLPLRPREFAVLFPQDGHKPGCLWQTTQPVVKVVMKVRL